MKKLPSVSIVIPTRNRPAMLAKCLDALLRLNHRHVLKEIIVVQDGSYPDVQTLLASIRPPAGIQLRCLSQPPSGANAARNKGIREATGDIVVLIDDDTVAPPGWLRKLLDPFRDRFVEVVVGASRLPLDGPILGRHREELKALLGEVTSPARTADGRPIPVACNMAVRRKVFDRGLFDETLRPPVEETEWFLRVQVRSRFEPEAWVWHDKSPEELRLVSLLRKSWQRGGEDGMWTRGHKRGARSQATVALSCFHGAARSFGHAAFRICWGGTLTGTSQLARGLAVLGLIRRGRGL